MLWHLFVLPPSIHTDAPSGHWAPEGVLGTVLDTRDTPSKQSRGGPALLGLTAWYPPLQLPDEGGPAPGHSRGRPRDTS